MKKKEREVYASNGYLRGTWPPFRHNPLALIRVTNVLVKSHILAYKKMKAANAGIFAVQILAITDENLSRRLADYKEQLEKSVEEKSRKISAQPDP